MRLRQRLAALAGVVLCLWALYVWVLTPRIGWFPALLVGILGSLFLLLLLSSLIQLARGLRLRRLLRRPTTDLRSDGWIAWSGTAHPEAGSVPSPLSGSDCLAWEYEFEEKEPRGIDTGTRKWFGVGQVPWAIESAHGTVQIRCAVPPGVLPGRATHGDEARSRAVQITVREDSKDASGIGDAFAFFASLEELFDDADGSVRMDWRQGDPGSAERVQNLVERRLDPGAVVTAIGSYSASHRAFVPSRKGFWLHFGRADKVASEAVKAPLGLLAFALPTNALIQGLAIAAWLRAP